MSNDAFDGQILSEKLSKLNNSQQSIESLSKWCVTHRKKAKHIVETWDSLFKSSQKEQRVSFLYLANDILQNSRKKGSEFVNEFWKVLPASLKLVLESGDEQGKKAVTRLVDIWEERKVFGSRGQNLKNDLLSISPPVVTSVKTSNPIKIVKRDAHAVRIKLAVGGLPEKILTAFQSVFDDHPNEETALNNYTGAVQQLGKVLEDFENSLSQGNQNGSALLDKLQHQENTLQQCIEQLESAEVNRASLIVQLKEALGEQESKLELIRGQLRVARGQVEQVNNISKRLTLSSSPSHSIGSAIPGTEAVKLVEQSLPLAQPNSTPPLPPSQQPLSQPVISFAPSKLTDEDSKKAAAAAMAAKLAASTSSAQMLTSVLSSLVAEEAASMNGNFKSGSIFPPEKRPKLEKPISASDGSSDNSGNTSYFALQQQMSNMPLAPSMSQCSQMQTPFTPGPPPPQPNLSPANPPVSQYGAQSAGLMVGAIPYSYGQSTLPPPPPLPPHIAMNLARPTSQPLQQPQQQVQQQQQQQQPANGGFYRPPGIGFYGQNQAATPPVPRQ